jgi:hypothetical protein
LAACLAAVFAGVLAALPDGIMTNSGNEGADYVCTLPEATDGFLKIGMSFLRWVLV